MTIRFFKIYKMKEITKVEADKMALDGAMFFTAQQVYDLAITRVRAEALAKKEQITKSEQNELAEVKASLKHMVGVTVVSADQAGNLVREKMFFLPKQVEFVESFEKSETGIEVKTVTGTYLETELNLELDRVGLTFEKGKPVKEDEGESGEEDGKTELFKFAKSLVKGGGSKKEISAKMAEKFPDEDAEIIKGCVQRAYGEYAEEVLQKAYQKDEEDKP